MKIGDFYVSLQIATKERNMLYPIGIQNFEKLRDAGCIYIDKTRKIYELARTNGYVFLSRPRRFGKSLLVSTMEAYFSGRKDLFTGLDISSLEQDWIEYPVLHLDFTGSRYSEESTLNAALEQQLRNWEKKYGIVPEFDDYAARFKDVIDAAYAMTGRKVVILIDEYDKPIVDTIGDGELQEYNKNVLQGFYSVMKAKDGCIRFGFLTGVSKIGKLSVFSGLNNLMDISLDREYSDICGISESEMDRYFSGSVTEMASAAGLTDEDCRRKLKLMYDGYHFSENSPGMYNPFSLLNALRSKQFGEYWFETGTPSMLVRVIQGTSYDITRLSGDEADSSLLSGTNTLFENPVPLMYQTGYLTIKGYDPEFGIYTLGFPNLEVKDGFLNFILNYYAPVQSESTAALIVRMTRDLQNGKPDSFMHRLEALFSRTSYQIQGDCEKDFQYAMYIIFELMGEYVRVERATSNGRIDVTVETENFIYIIEVKVDRSPEEALSQIEDKHYARPFADDCRKIFKIGVNFSTSERCIDGWKIS